LDGGNLAIFAAYKSLAAMENPNYGRKGSCFLQFLLFLILFIILLIWVYNMNFKLTF
jgi:hypothetical protein